MKKFKLLVEFINQKETEGGFIWLRESVTLMKDISKTAKKNGFDAFAKWQKKEVIDYIPSWKEILLETVEDIANLTPEQFEIFVDDLRSWCEFTRWVDSLKSILWDAVNQEKWMRWLDNWKQEAKVEITTTNQL